MARDEGFLEKFDFSWDGLFVIKEVFNEQENKAEFASHDVSTGHRVIRYIPNTLSTLRILLALLFPVFPESVWLWIILISGLSDGLDGMLARHFKVQSWLGGILDGVADKVFVLVVLVTFAATGRIGAWWLPLLLSRDLLVAAVALYAALQQQWSAFLKMDVRWSGKAATMTLFALFVNMLVLPEHFTALLLVSSFCSLAAAMDYSTILIRELAHRKQS